MRRRAVVVVLDGVGVGAAVDAHAFGDAGADTLGHVAAAAGGLCLPCLGRLGLGAIAPVAGVPPATAPAALVGRLAERSAAKDTTTGHWELMGRVTEVAPPTYPEGFPPEVVQAVLAAMAAVVPPPPPRRALGNRPESGTEVIARLGAEHLLTRDPIVYTSADSVLQVAAHDAVWDEPTLHAACAAARGVMSGAHAVSRVIARPFTGAPGAFRRTAGRRDLSLEPGGPTALDVLRATGVPVEGVGKIAQIFAGRGVSGDHPTRDNAHGMQVLADLLGRVEAGLVFANLVDFDTHFGHRNDPAGFAACLERFDADLAGLLPALGPDDLLVITADHGNDPVHPTTDHTREWVPLLVHVPGRDPAGARWVGEMGDVGRTVLAWLAPGASADRLSGRPLPLAWAGAGRPPELSSTRT